MEAIDPARLSGPSPAEPSRAVRERVQIARERARDRQGLANADLPDALTDRHCALSPDARGILERAIRIHALSARAVPRLLRVARTCADLDGAPALTASHLSEAIRWRLPLASPRSTHPEPAPS